MRDRVAAISLFVGLAAVLELIQRMIPGRHSQFIDWFASSLGAGAGMSAPESYEGTRGFRAWWTKPGREFTPCACGWRPDLGQHYRVQRFGPVVGRR
jgi:hypothetical protein